MNPAQPSGNPLILRSAQPFDDFQAAAEAVLEFLQIRLGFSLWVVVRTEGPDWIILVAKNTFYDVREGQVFPWAESLCYRMVQGAGPSVAPQVQAVPAYATAPIRQQVPVEAYMGIPLYLPGGILFGTLCAIDPMPQSVALVQELPLLQLQGQLLSTLITADLNTQTLRRSLQQAQAAALTDSLTQINNRRGWDQFIEIEEQRCQRYGSPAVVIILDLDDLKQLNDEQGHQAGDDLLRRTAAHLKQTVRTSDVVARLGGDEFGILMVEFAPQQPHAIVQRLYDTLASAGIAASIGWAVRQPHASLQVAVEQADIRMYAVKRGRKELAQHAITHRKMVQPEARND